MASFWRVAGRAAVFVSLCLATLAFIPRVDAETLVFQQGADGYGGTVDTFLKGAAPDTSQGSAAVIEWDGEDDGGINYTLLRFEGLFGSGAGQIPSGSTIHSAILTYDIVNTGHLGDVNEVLVPWTSATTYNSFGGSPGVQPDDYDVLVGGAPGNALGSASLDVTASLVRWLSNPASNWGWIFRPTGTDGVEIRSGENAELALRPKLTVTVTPPVIGIRLTPDHIQTVVGKADCPVTVAIEAGANADRAVQVTLTSDNPAVASPTGGTGGELAVVFPAGGAEQQTIYVEIGAAGSATITTTNNAGLEDDSLAVEVAAGHVTFNPPSLTGLEERDVWIQVAITPGSNETRPVAVTLYATQPDIAVPANAVNGELVLLFAQGGPPAQPVLLRLGSRGPAAIVSANDGGLDDAHLPVHVIAREWITVVDPYADVDWATFGQHKSNLHTHTTQSDGSLTPAEAIDEYHQRGYSILALTDHNRCTWPWQNWGRDPNALGMVAIAGNEASNHHHMNSFFIQYETTSNDLERTLGEVGAAGGLAMLNHPGRYSYTVQNYVGWFTTYGHLIGLEVINQGGRYNGNWSPVWPGNDIYLWDQILSILMPDRPVWGLACDDMHTLSHLGRDWNTFLLADLTEAQVRDAMQRGQFYFSSVATHPTAARDVTQTPVIDAMVRDEAGGTITLSATSGGQPLPASDYCWISMGMPIHVGPTLDYLNTPGVGTYVRAELIGQGGTSLTNPFGIVIEVPTLWLSHDRIERCVHWRDSLPADSFTAANTGPGTLNYTVTVDADWLWVAPESGTCAGEPVAVGLSYDVADLPIGLHEAVVTVSSPEAFNGPQTLAVSVDVRSVRPDLDWDGDVDLDDFALLQACLTGAYVPQKDPVCARAKLDNDGDVDIQDLNRMRLCFSGADIPADPACDD